MRIKRRYVSLFMAIFAMGFAVTSCGDDDNEFILEAPEGVEAVDLGVVVDGKKVLWANMNVGAESSIDCGDYFAWGETVPYGGEDKSNAMNYNREGSFTKTYYGWETYKYCMNSEGSKGFTMTKYVLERDASRYGYNGFYDNKTVLDPKDDAATANWGSDWRMPTHAEYRALYEQCIWTWVTTYNGMSVNGYKVTGNGHEIFLPATGYHYGSSPNSVGSDGFYWSSSLSESNPSNVRYLYFYSDRINPDYYNGRLFGFPVRPVRAAKN